jgi:hypothetical protein
VLWHAINVLREHRGDGHIAALLVAGLDPCQALVSFAAIGAAPKETFASRGWREEEWSAARDRLAARGWVDAAARLLSVAGTAGMRSNGAPTGWPMPSGGRWAPAARSGSPSSPAL